MLTLDNVSRSYRAGANEVAAVRGVSASVDAGSLTAIMGPSGCGKSTLLTLSGGLQQPDDGAVTVAGAELGTLSEADLYRHRRQHIGYVFQDYNLVRILTVAENVALPAELNGMSRRSADSLAREALGLVGMEEYADRYPDTLSGGQQQRTALARAICGDRRLILADEPTGALDSTNATQILDVLVRLVRDGAACLVVTHDHAVAARADRVIHMRDGVIERAVAG